MKNRSITKSVLIIAPCWPETGAMNLVVSGLACYAALDCDIHLLLVDMGASVRFGEIETMIRRNLPTNAGQVLTITLLPQRLTDQLYMGLSKPYLQALTERIASAKFPVELENYLLEHGCDIIHTHHCWNLSLAKRLAQSLIKTSGKRPKIICETHDVQSKNWDVLTKGFWGKFGVFQQEKVAEYEINLCKLADALIHINTKDLNYFNSRIPQVTSFLLQPGLLPETEKSLKALARTPINRDGEMVLVAADNYWNVRSVSWFLAEVMPSIGSTAERLAIFGRIKQQIRKKDRALFKTFVSNFKGVIPDQYAAYESARLILLPVLGGTGTSIRLIEALCTGCPVIMSAAAARGYSDEVAGLDGIVIADSASDFAIAIKRAFEHAATPVNRSSAMLRAYDRHFSVDARRRGFRTIIENL